MELSFMGGVSADFLNSPDSDEQGLWAPHKQIEKIICRSPSLSIPVPPVDDSSTVHLEKKIMFLAFPHLKCWHPPNVKMIDYNHNVLNIYLQMTRCIF